MTPSSSLTSYADALAAVLADAGSLGTEKIALARAPGRILAEDLVATFDLPRFDNTAVDGFAIHGADLDRANRDGFADVTLGMTVPAGEALLGRILSPGIAARVLTGSPLPPGTAAVVMQEDVESRGDSRRIFSSLTPGQHIRRQGEEFRLGALVARTPQPFTPPLCALAAAIGQTQVSVARAPRVGLLVTGSELIAPGQPLQDAQIYESNGPGLAAALHLAGIAALDVRTVSDSLEPTVAALSTLLDANDVVITSGGVSVGSYDAVKEALEQLGVERRVWRVAMKPGKPFYFGVRHRAGRKTAVFGLPGNPLSALVTFSVFAFPYLRAVQGITAASQTFSATLATTIRKPAGRLEFVPVTLGSDASGWRATPLDKRASHMLGGFAQAQALAVFSAELEKLEAGARVECRRLPWT